MAIDTVLPLRHLDMPSEQLAGQPDIPHVAEKVDVTTDDRLGNERVRQAVMKLPDPDGDRLPPDQDNTLLPDDFLQARNDSLRLIETQRRRHSERILRLWHLRGPDRRSGQGAGCVQIDPCPAGRERKRLGLALELRLRLAPRSQRLLVGAASPLLFRKALLGIEIFCMHVHRLPEG